MQKITKKEVLHVANLARLDIESKDIEKFCQQIESILKYVDILNRVDTKGVAPTYHTSSLFNAFRDDEISTNFKLQDALDNAPEIEEDQFVVPKII